MSETNRVNTPYSYASAVAAGDTIYLGLHRGCGIDFESQLRDTFASLNETLSAFDLNLKHIVKVHVWLKRIEDLPLMEKIFLDYFQEGKYPARMTATTDFVDSDCLLMIDGTAYRKEIT